MSIEKLDAFPFEFYGDVFSLYLASDRRLYVSVADCCRALEIDHRAQNRRIRRDEVLNDALVSLKLEIDLGEGRTRTGPVNCLWLHRLPYWLGSIDTARISDQDKREKIVQFKREFADIAWAAFRTEILPPDVLAEMDAALPPAQQEYHRAMDEAAELRRSMDEYGQQIDALDERISGLEARFVGTDFINSQQAHQYLKMVNTLGELLKKKKAGNQAIVHNQIKQVFQVPSYQLIPEEDFPKVVTYLTEWWKNAAPSDALLPSVFKSGDQRRLF
ncbi:MAG: hypothetical protein GY796_13285 [Chloroflexi bacterium]|nr:hypothetical protein [Chloroflexota bacterium]